MGLGLYASLSLLGLSAILVQYQWLAWAVRICGGLYLAWLGIKLLMTRPEIIEIDAGETRSGNPLAFGFLVDAHQSQGDRPVHQRFCHRRYRYDALWVMALMIGLVMLSSATWYTLVTLFMSVAPR